MSDTACKVCMQTICGHVDAWIMNANKFVAELSVKPCENPGEGKPTTCLERKDPIGLACMPCRAKYFREKGKLTE